MKKNYLLLIAILFFPLQSIAQGFTDVTHDAGINFLISHDQFIGGGVAFFDYNNDGFEDIYITGGKGLDRLYHNNGDGTFMDVTIDAGFLYTANVMSHSVVTGDIDNDGFREVFIGTNGFNFVDEPTLTHCLLFYNNGNGTFTDISETAGIIDSAWTAAATFGDFNLDGYLDIYATNYLEETDVVIDSMDAVLGFAHTCYPDFLYMNNGNSTFTQVASGEGLDKVGCGLAVAATDFDDDCDPDIMVVNDFGEWVEPNVLLENNYPVTGYTDISQSSGADVDIYGMGIAIGDYDEDLDLDYYMTNLGRNVLLRNEGNDSFMDVTTSAGVENTAVDTLLTTSWGTAFFDYDNDSYLDLYVSNGYVPAAALIATTLEDPNKLYRNNRDGTFTDIADTLGVNDHYVGRGMALGDYDNDGDLDMIVAILDTDRFGPNILEQTVLYRNDLNNAHNWLKVKLTGTENNRDGFGAHLLLKAGGRTFMREVGGGSSHASQNSSIVHFGLGDIANIDSLMIRWLGCGTQVITDVPINQQINIVESLPVAVEQPTADNGLLLYNLPNPFITHTTIAFQVPQSGYVKLSLYNGLGQEVAVLTEEYKMRGRHELPLSANAFQLTAGLYFAVLETNGLVLAEKIMLH